MDHFNNFVDMFTLPALIGNRNDMVDIDTETDWSWIRAFVDQSPGLITAPRAPCDIAIAGPGESNGGSPLFVCI